MPRHLALMRLGEILPAERNPKNHDETLIEQGIDRFGLVDVPTLDERTGRLVSGHGRTEDLTRRRAAGLEPPDGIEVDDDGEWLVPVQRGWSSANDDEALAAGIAINEASHRGGWNVDELTRALADLEATSGLVGVGFDSSNLADLVSDLGATEYGPKVISKGPVAIAKLKPHPRNARAHPEDQVAHMAASIEENGYLRNVIAARDLTILSGHGLVLATELLERETAPTTVVDLDPDDPQALKILAVDELFRFAEVDDRALTELLREISETSSLFGTGYDEMILANLLMVTRPASEIANRDAAAEWVGMPDYEPEGDTLKFVVQFRTEDDRTRFLEEFDLRRQVYVSKTTATVISAWWPIPTETRHSGDVKWVEAS